MRPRKEKTDGVKYGWSGFESDRVCIQAGGSVAYPAECAMRKRVTRKEERDEKKEGSQSRRRIVGLVSRTTEGIMDRRCGNWCVEQKLRRVLAVAVNSLFVNAIPSVEVLLRVSTNGV